METGKLVDDYYNNMFDDYYEKSLLQGGTMCCPGCGGPLFWRMMLEALGPNTVIYGGAPCAGCAARNVKLPRFGLHFSGVGDGAAGMKAAFRVKGREDITVLSVNGDGAVGDISFGKASASAERNDDIIQVTIDNESYMNTGGQKSGLTPFGARTTTTPLGKTTAKKRIPFIMIAHKVPYVATVSVAYPRDLKAKFTKAKNIKGYRYIHTIMPCPTGWQSDPAQSIKVVRLGVQTWVWPLIEVEDGVLKLSVKPQQKPVQEYLQTQRRFRVLSKDKIEFLQRQVDRERQWLLDNDGKALVV